MARGQDINLSFRAGTTNDEGGVTDKFSQEGRPKLKFNFTVSFKFRSPIRIRNNLEDNAIMDDELTFALKQASRPNPTIVYQDVNYYNYRTKVATKVDYGTLQMQFYDDVENFGHNVYEAYLKAVSPVAGIRKEEVNDAFAVNNVNGPKNAPFNTQGFFGGDQEPLAAGTGSIGPLPNDQSGAGGVSSPGGEQGLIEYIALRHWFWSDAERREDNTFDERPQIQYVEYQYLNPKIINMTLDELDMTQSDVSTIMMNFVYDSVFIDSPEASNTEPLGRREGDGNSFTLNDIRGQVNNIERIVRRVRRLDTLPDIGIVNAASTIIPPISGNLPNIALPKPVVDVFGVLGT